MKVDVTTVGSFQKKLAFTVPPEQVATRLDQAYRRVAGQVRIAGFRPGKAPRKVLEGRFAQQIEAEVANDLIQQGYRTALTDHALQPIGNPSLETSSPVVEPDGFKFTITVDVRPEIALTEWTGLDVEYPSVEVTPEEVDRAVKARLEGQAKLEEVSDRPVTKGDLALVELVITDPDGIAVEAALSEDALSAIPDLDLSDLEVEGIGADRVRISGPAEKVRACTAKLTESKPDLSITDVPGPLEVAREPGTMIRTEGDPYYPGVDDFVVGMSSGETKTGKVAFASGARMSPVAGRTLAVEAKLIQLQSYRVPELDDELAGTLGFEGGAEGMRTAIAAQIQQSREELARNQARANLLQVVIDKNPFDVPQGMVEQSLQMLLEELRQQQAIRTGRDPKTIGFSEAQVQDLRMRSSFAAKAALILEWVAKREGITVTDADIESKYQFLANERGQTIEAVKGWFQKEDATDELKDRILEEKTLDWMLERSNFTTPKASTDAGAVNTAVLDGAIDGLKAALDSGALDGQLDALREAEEKGRNRDVALAAIDARKNALKSSAGPSNG